MRRRRRWNIYTDHHTAHDHAVVSHYATADLSDSHDHAVVPDSHNHAGMPDSYNHAGMPDPHNHAGVPDRDASADLSTINFSNVDNHSHVADDSNFSDYTSSRRRRAGGSATRH